MPKMMAASVTLLVLPLRDARSCPACGSPADAHQPDERLPDRLLLTCRECGEWTLLAREEGTGRVAGLALPACADLLARRA